MTLTTATLLAAALLLGWLAYPGLAQEQPKAETPPPAATPSVLPRPYFHFPGNVGRTYLDSDPPQFPQPVQAPHGAPNVVLILIDDAGFG
jgi:arylsulfatase